jgi:hypothetical protein
MENLRDLTSFRGLVNIQDTVVYLEIHNIYTILHIYIYTIYMVYMVYMYMAKWHVRVIR